MDLEHYAFYENSGELLSIINDNTLDIFAINRLSFVKKCKPLSGISDHHVIVTMCLQYQKPTLGKIYYGTKLTLVILEMHLNNFYPPLCLTFNSTNTVVESLSLTLKKNYVL